jgi:hypothetical protein
MMVAIHNLHVEYGRCAVKWTYKNVLNHTVIFTNGIGVSLATPYIAIRIMEDTGLCDGGNVRSYC